MVFEYRVFLLHDGEELSFTHFSDEKLWVGAVVRANKPESVLHGLKVEVERVASHPTEDTPGIAYGLGA
jgi:hypothetical protein